jgi:hypothetical protein
MAESCTTFNPHRWKPNICCDCNKKKEDHPNIAAFDGIQTPDGQVPISQQRADNDVQSTCSQISEQHCVLLVQESPQMILPPCRYGVKCYRTNPHHYEQFSHPPGHKREPIQNLSSQPVTSINVDHRRTSPVLAVIDNSSSSTAAISQCDIELKTKSNKHKRKELRFIELVEGHVQELITSVQLKDQEIEKLRCDMAKMVKYHQSLEKALTDELDYRERREYEQQHNLAIPRQTPSYWGPNAFSESYREIQIPNDSPEFDIINNLLNATIETHGDLYGTIYGKDPTEFLVTQIKRIQNIRLWHEYCYKKVRVSYFDIYAFYMFQITTLRNYENMTTFWIAVIGLSTL